MKPKIPVFQDRSRQEQQAVSDEGRPNVIGNGRYNMQTALLLVPGAADELAERRLAKQAAAHKEKVAAEVSNTVLQQQVETTESAVPETPAPATEAASDFLASARKTIEDIFDHVKAA